MCLQCDGWSAAKVERHINDLIERHGWAIQYVEDPNPRRRFGYTVGLTTFGVPEFLVRGLEMDETMDILNSFAYSAARLHEPFGHGHTGRLDDGRRLYFSAMHGAGKFAFGVFSRYGQRARVLEIHFMERDAPPPTGALMFKTLSLPTGGGPVAGRKH